MQNINIHGARPKRSVQSLIQDSSIDQQKVLNIQIIQMKKAYNQTYKGFNAKIQTLQAQIAKYKQKCKRLQQANVMLSQRWQNLQKQNKEFNNMKMYCQKMKRKVLYVEGKYQKLLQNRSLVSEDYQKEQKQKYRKWALEGTSNQINMDQFANKNQIYKEITDLMNYKIKGFTQELKQFHMNQELQIKIQNFLQELIYITPVSANQTVKFDGLKNRQVGKLIKKPSNQPILMSNQAAWRDLQKSIDKAKQINKSAINQMTPQRSRKQQINRDSTIRKNRSPLSHYNNSYQNQPQIRSNYVGKSRSKIFNN